MSFISISLFFSGKLGPKNGNSKQTNSGYFLFRVDIIPSIMLFFFGWKSIAKYVKYAKQVLESIKKREFGQLKRIFPETQKTVTLFRCFHNPLMASG